MRRKDRKIRDRRKIDAVIRGASHCVLSLCDRDRPYGVPLCFGYENGMVFLHSARIGRKLDLIERNPHVSLTFVKTEGPAPAENPCKWGFHYCSVIAEGTAERIKNTEEKQRGLNAVMKQYGGQTFDFNNAELERTAVIRVRLTSLSGKHSLTGTGETDP